MSNSKKIGNFMQRALSSIDSPVSLTSLLVSLHYYTHRANSGSSTTRNEATSTLLLLQLGWYWYETSALPLDTW